MANVANLKNLRRIVRGSFRKALTAFQDEQDFAKKKLNFTVLQDKYNRMVELDNNIQMTINDENDLEKDFSKSEEYREEFISAQHEFNVFIDKNGGVVSKGGEPSGLLKFSKVTPRKIDLSPKTWCTFYGQFKAVHESNIPKEEKFQLLLQCLEPDTAAFKIAESYPPLAANYASLFDHLKRRFGREELIIDTAIRVLVDEISTQKKTLFPELVDRLHTQIRTLQALGVGSDKYELFLYPMLEKTLPPDVLAAWLSRSYDIDMPDETASVVSNASATSGKVDRLMDFLDHQVENMEHIQSLQVDQLQVSRPSIATLHSGYQLQCIFCNGKHKASLCRNALKLDVNERRRIVQEKRACFTCLNVGHSAQFCKEKIICKFCNKGHFPIVCFSRNDTKKVEEVKGEPSNVASVSVNTDVVYLKTLVAKVVYGKKEKLVRVFLDDGSQRSYIRHGLAKELNLKHVDEVLLTQTLFGGLETEPGRRRVFNVNVAPLDGKDIFSVSLIAQERICQPLPSPSSSIIKEFAGRGVKLQDVPGADIDILLGSDMIPSLLTGKVCYIKNLIASETKLGWVLQGGKGKATKVVSMLCCTSNDNGSLPLFCELESLGIQSPSSKVTLEDFQDLVKVTDEGRLSVNLPWIADHPPLNSGKNHAIERLNATTQRLKKQSMYEVYDDVLEAWEKDQIIERVHPSNDDSLLTHYLPHRPVFKKESKTTPVRPVFDASCKVTTGVSLNDCVDKGPNMLPAMLDILLKFREEKFAITADIKQAFLAIEVDPIDRDVLRFLWWDKEGNLTIFRHRRVVFGLSCSPYILNASIVYVLNEITDPQLADTVTKLKGSFYVDNCLASFRSAKEAVKFKEEAVKIFAERHFVLRAWNSNAREVVNSQSDDVELEKVLGLRWNVKSDTLTIESHGVNLTNDDIISKRKILAICNAIYDPLGICSAVTIVPKIILQKVWKEKVDWDDEISSDLKKQFLEWYSSSHMIDQCKIPRGVGICDDATLHFFCDASGVAFASCAFLVSGSEMRFVIAKARVGPVSKISIPRMELMGACVAARLYNVVKDSWDRQVKVIFWTDSTVVLYWLRKQGPWKTFVSNRVKEINELTPTGSWKFVSGLMNPADIPSRGCSVKELIESRWLEGPQWLLRPEEDWPQEDTEDVNEIASTEQRVCVNVSVGKEFFSATLTKHVSKYTKLVNLVAYIYRFVHNAKSHEKIRGKLHADEIEAAEKVLFRLVQAEWPNEEMKKCGLRLEVKDGLICLRTKVSEGDRFLVSPPVLVDNPITRRLICYTHEEMCHATTNTTLLKLREKVWIIRGRQLTRQIVQRCVVCKKQMARPVIPLEAPLPPVRFNTNVGSFQKSGVDYGGPIFLRNNVKAWIVLFTCAVFRCIHLELVTSLSTDSFMQALRRFIARRGPVDVIICDNATTHVGAKNLLESIDSIDWNEVEAASAVHRIKFHFICPASPWMGGWWEVMIKAAKTAIRKCLGNACVTYEEMLTVLCDVERVVNDRPLTYVSDDPDSLKPLTPSMFLFERSHRSDVEAIDVIDEKSANRRLQYLQELREHVKERFKKEYLTQLVMFSQNKNPRRELEVGEIVMIETDNKKRVSWPLAKILELFTGKDGHTRIAKVKTSTGELLRPVRKLYPLEVSSLNQEMPVVDSDDVEESPLNQEMPDVDADKVSFSQQQGGNVDKLEEPKVSKGGRLIRKPQRLNL